MELKIRNNKKNESANAASKQQVNNAAIKREQSGAGSGYAEREQGRPKGNANNEPVVHEVDVIGMMTALKRDGHVKLSDHFKDAEVVEPIEEVKPEPKAAPAPKAETKKSAPKAKPVTIKRKVTLKKKQAPAAAAPAAYSVVLLPTKDGSQWPKLYGFKSEEDAKSVADKMPKSVTASWDYGPNGEGRETKTRHWCLKMGKRYCDAAKQLCDALNSGNAKAIAKAVADSQDVYELAKAEGKAADEIKRQEREAAKEEPAPAAKTYTQADIDKAVADALKKVLDGGALPENVKRLMAAA